MSDNHIELSSRSINWVLFLLLFSGILFAKEKESGLDLYHKAIEAKTIGQREEGLEKALAWYMKTLDESEQQNRKNGYLYYNIGNCYFNLFQIGNAVYYYRMALKYLPENEKIQGNLEVALKKRKNAVDIERGLIENTLLFFHYRIHAEQRISLLILLCCLVSAVLIVPGKKWWSKAILSLGFTAILALAASLAFDYYSPLHIGVLIEQTDIRKDKGRSFAPLTKKPIGTGSTIRVLKLEEEWYLVKLADGRKGYINKNSLKLLQ